MYKLTGRLGGAVLKSYARRRRDIADPPGTQQRQLLQLVGSAATTSFGRDHDFASIRSVADYQQRVPIRTFEDFWSDYWAEPFPLLDDVTWPGRIPFFARSSGTTTGRSKHIPCSDEMVRSNNRAGIEVLLHHLQQRPESTVAQGRTFLFGGTPHLEELAPGVLAGDLSGIAANQTPWWAGRDRYYPPADLAGIADWDQKVEQLAIDCVDKDIRAISGVPTWLQILFTRALDAAEVPSRHLVELFPDLELLTHGGVSFEPYQQAIADLLTDSRAETREVYAASEGFVAVADRQPGQGMRMLLDNGLFYEFVPVDELAAAQPQRRWIDNVEPDTDYALLLTSNAGLWSYAIGDTIRFVDLTPPRLLVTGRTAHTLSTFGEHLSGEQLTKAVATAASKTGTAITDFTVAPIQTPAAAPIGHHHYIIETTSQTGPQLATEIDAALSAQNADYATRRRRSIAIGPPEVTTVAHGTFAAWMASRGRAGGQNKIPRVTTPQQQDEIRSHDRQSDP